MTPPECKPRLWKRYVDDILDVVKKGQVKRLNSIDSMGSIKFMVEEEVNGSIPFLDLLITLQAEWKFKCAGI